MDSLEVALKRGFMLLADGNFEKADDFFEQALNIDPENVDAYKGKLLAELEIKTESELENYSEPFAYSDNYKKILAFADSETKCKFENYNNEIIYKNAVTKMNSATSSNEYRAASNVFANISSYKNSSELKIECDNYAVYFEALECERIDTIKSLNRAIEKYSNIKRFKDALIRIDSCKTRIQVLEEVDEKQRQENKKRQKELEEKAFKQKSRLKKGLFIGVSAIAIFTILTILIQSIFIPSSKYNNAIEFYNNGKYTEAATIFEELNGYKDSETYIKDCKYKSAIRMLNNGQYNEALSAFKEISRYKDSLEKSNTCIYNIAASLFNDGDFFEAAKTYYSIINYSDSKEKCYLAWDKITKTKSSIANGTNLILGLKENGTVVADGENNYGQADVSNWNKIISVACSGSHSVGLKSDGTVVATGLNEDGQCNVEKWTDIIAISANENCTVGLKSDGTCIATGDNDYGQCNVSEWENIVNISTSGLHTVGLVADGTLVATGNNKHNECDVLELKDIVDISCGYDITAAINHSGYIVTVGADNGATNRKDWNTVKTISFYSGTSCIAIRNLKSTVSCVYPTFHSSLDKQDFERDFDNFYNVVEVAAGYQIMIGLKEDGTVVQAGELDYKSFDGDTACVRNTSSEWDNILVRNKG